MSYHSIFIQKLSILSSSAGSDSDFYDAFYRILCSLIKLLAVYAPGEKQSHPRFPFLTKPLREERHVRRTKTP